MARAVNVTLDRIFAQQRGLSEEEGQEIVKQMRSTRSYQVSSLQYYVTGICSSNSTIGRYLVELMQEGKSFLSGTTVVGQS
jgi:hypothetical protein